MMKDLAALTPPFLMAVAFLVAAAAFVRHEMGRGKKPAEDLAEGADDADSDPDSARGGDNEADGG